MSPLLEWINSDTGQPLAPGDTGPYYWRLSMPAQPQTLTVTDAASREAAIKKIDELSAANKYTPEDDLRHLLVRAVKAYDHVTRTQTIAITDDAGREAAVREITELADAPSQSAEAQLRRDLARAVAQYDEVKHLREVEASYRKAAEARDTIAPDPQMLFFGFNHLPDSLQEVSRPFHAMASWMIRELPDNDQRTIALQRLLEAKDAALRSKLLPRG